MFYKPIKWQDEKILDISNIFCSDVKVIQP